MREERTMRKMIISKGNERKHSYQTPMMTVWLLQGCQPLLGGSVDTTPPMPVVDEWPDEMPQPW